MESNSSRGIQKKIKPPNRRFLHQPANDYLCAFYAYCHFKDGCDRQYFINKAAEYYHRETGLPKEKAKDFVKDGNDPDLLKEFRLEKAKNYKKALEKGKLIIARKSPPAHFYTFIKDKGNWWNYDSLQQKPSLIGDDKKAADFLKRIERKDHHFWIQGGR